MEFRKATLDNGLEVIAECNNEVHSAALGFFVKTGSRDETPEIAGVSHFLEHMVFKGTPTRTADDVNREFDDMGAENNAYTSKESTAYWAALLPEFLDKSIELLADVLRPSLREEDFDTEKQVIIEEIRMYEDQPPFGADEKCEELHFGSHPLANSVLGTVESIERLPVEAMREYFQRRYSPRNIALAAAGKIDFDAFVEMAQRHCGGWEPFETSRVVAPAERCPGFTRIEKPSAMQQYAVQLCAAPANDRPQRYAADLLSTILGDTSGSRLYWDLIDPGLAEHAALYYAEYQGAGIFWTVLSCEPDLAGDNLQHINNIYRDARASGVTQAEFDQAKSKTKSRTVLSGERSRRRLFTVGNGWIQRGEYLSVRDELELIDEVTLDEVNAVLQAYSLLESTTVTVGPSTNVSAPQP